MAASNLIVIYLLLSLSYSIRCVVCATLTVAPVSVTTAPFTSVEFTCEGIGDRLTWIVESAPLDDAIEQQRNISVTDSHSGSNLSSVLTIPALPVNDNIGIGCRIISLNPFNEVFAAPSTLTIRGVSSVEDLELNFLSYNSLHLTWSPPVFYSNDVPLDTPVYYQVVVTSETGEPIVDRNVSTTSIILANITKCDTINCSVTVSRAQYTSVSNSIGNNGSYSIDIKGHSVTVNEVPIFFRVTSTPTLCVGIVSIEPFCVGHNISAHQLVVDGSNEPDKLINYTLTDLDPFRRYNISVKVMDLKNQPEDEDYLMISTYHVQNVTIDSQQYTNGSVRVKCLFIEGGSTADGCHVIFTSTTDQAIEPQAFNITGSNERIVTLSVSSNYTVTAYDLVNGTIIGPSIEYSTPVEVIILPAPPPVSATSSISSSSSSISVISYKATNSTLSVTSVSVSPTVASNIPQATDENQTVFTARAIAVICVILLLLLVSLGSGVIVAVCFVTKRSRKKPAVNGEMALCYQPHANTNDYMERPQLTNVLFNTVPDSPARDQSTPAVSLVEDPYFVHRNEFVPATGHPPLPSVANATTTNMEQLPPVNIQASDVVIPQRLYAELAPATNRNTVPHKPPTGDTSVQYSVAAGHTNEGGMTTYPINECPPPPKYENINQFSSPVQEENSSNSQYAPIVHKGYERSPSSKDSEDVAEYSTASSSLSSNEEMTIPVTVGNTLPAVVVSPNEDDAKRKGVQVMSSHITANHCSASNTTWQFKSASYSRPYTASIVFESPIEDTPVVGKMTPSNELFTSELVIASYKVSFPICGFSPVHTLSVTEETSNYEVLPVVKPEKMGIINVMDENESNTKICNPSTEGIVLRESKMMSKLKVMFTNLQQKSLLEHDTFLCLQVSFSGRVGDIKFNMCSISVPCLFNGYYPYTANQMIVQTILQLAHVVASDDQWDIPNVVYFRPERDKSRPVEMTLKAIGWYNVAVANIGVCAVLYLCVHLLVHTKWLLIKSLITRLCLTVTLVKFFTTQFFLSQIVISCGISCEFVSCGTLLPLTFDPDPPWECFCNHSRDRYNFIPVCI